MSFFFFLSYFFFFQAEDGIRDLVRSRGLGDVYKRQVPYRTVHEFSPDDASHRAAPEPASHRDTRYQGFRFDRHGGGRPEFARYRCHPYECAHDERSGSGGK